MKENTKFIVKNSFLALVNNDAAIEGAKKAPWWMALGFFLLSVGLPLIPIATNIANSKGSNAFSSYVLDLDKNLTAVALDLKDNGATLEVKDGELTYKVNGTVINHYDSDAEEPIYFYQSEKEEFTTLDNGEVVPTGNILYQNDFYVYYSSEEGFASDKSSPITKLASYLNSKQYIVGSTNEKSESDPAETKYYTPSFVILSKKSIYVSLYEKDTCNQAIYTKYAADWKATKDCELVARTLDVKDITADADKTIANLSYVEGVYKNWLKVFDESYKTVKDITMRNSLLIYAGVYAVLIVLMGFMLWILTRGKNNPFNYLNFWITSKIAAWASLAPALLGLIGGFIFSQYAPFIFIIMLGIRVMWLSMKNLRPQY